MTLSKAGLVLVLVLSGCGATVVSPTLSTPSSSPSVSPSQVACVVTDQDKYIYHPARLKVIAACRYATGAVVSMKREADGDFHIRVALDPAYAGLINQVNVSGQHGDLVVEPVCEVSVTQADAVSTCAQDHDPISVAKMKVGQHIWLTGRYVTDSQHGGWAEFHPLYGWGILP